MSVQHFKSLLFKSARIQEEIDWETSRPWPDWIRLLKLKKIRLSIKDRMAKLMRSTQIQTWEPVRIPVRTKSAKNLLKHNPLTH